MIRLLAGIGRIEARVLRAATVSGPGIAPAHDGRATARRPSSLRSIAEKSTRQALSVKKKFRTSELDSRCRRRLKDLRAFTASHANDGGEDGLRMSYLEASAVARSTQTNCRKALLAFCSSMGSLHLLALNKEEFGDLLTDRLQDMFLEGQSPSAAGLLLAAVLWARPRLPRPLRAAFPRAHRAWRGWQKLDPSFSRPPLLWPAVAGIVVSMLRGGCYLEAVATLLTFTLYSRPMELLRLEAFQLLPPAPELGGTGASWAVVVAAAELKVPTKTGDYDATPVIDRPELHFLGAHLAGIRQVAILRGSLWTFTHRERQATFRAAGEAAGVGSLRPTLYGLRHGGASYDRASQFRPLHEVEKRGRWRSTSAVKRYDKHGRINLEWNEIPSGARAILAAQAHDLERHFDVHWPVLYKRHGAGVGENDFSSASGPGPEAWQPDAGSTAMRRLRPPARSCGVRDVASSCAAGSLPDASGESSSICRAAP